MAQEAKKAKQIRNKPQNIYQCPDMHLPRNKYEIMETNNEAKDDIKQQNPHNKNDDEECPCLEVVHISDTHLKHRRLQSKIPYGDILIHSGDFVNKCKWKNNEDNIHPRKLQTYFIIHNITSPKELQKFIPLELFEFNEWIGTMPHKYKVVIAGNHEICFNELSKEFIQTYILTNCIYLQDSEVEIHGLKIYGSPWTKCSKMAFSYGGKKQFLYSKWKSIPSDTDIVITHLPPLGIYDLAWGSKYNFTDKCALCGDIHKKYKHWGCSKLLDNIENRIKPKLHLFGHVHDSVGYKLDDKNDILFINSAMDLGPNVAHRVKLVFDL